MRDLPPLGLPRLPGSPPRSDVLDEVVRRGRQRLVRAAAGTTTVVALIVAGALGSSLLGTDGGGSVVLVPASPEPDGEVSEPTTEASAPPDLVPATPSPGSLAHAMSPEPAEVAPGGTQSAGPRPRIVSPSPRPGARPYREQPTTTAGSMSCDVAEVIAGTPPGTRVCAMASASRTTTPVGGYVDVEALLCNSLSSDRAYVAEFRSGREHDLRASYGEFSVWTWSRAFTFPQGAHERPIDPGYCLSWTTRWDTRDDEGRLVDPGIYYLDATIEVADGTRQFTIRVNVTPEPTPSASPSAPLS